MELEEIRNKKEILREINNLAATVTYAIASYEKLLKEQLETIEYLDPPLTFEQWEEILEENDPVHDLSRRIQEGIFKLIWKVEPVIIPKNNYYFRILKGLLLYVKECQRVIRQLTEDLKIVKEPELRNELMFGALIDMERVMNQYLSKK